MPTGGRHSISILTCHLALPRSDSVPSSQCFPFIPVLFIPVLSVRPSALCAHSFAHNTSSLLSIYKFCPFSVLSAQHPRQLSTPNLALDPGAFHSPQLFCIRPGALRPFSVLCSFFVKHTSQLLSITALCAFLTLSIHSDCRLPIRRSAPIPSSAFITIRAIL
jgi:hypothetical protein